MGFVELMALAAEGARLAGTLRQNIAEAKAAGRLTPAQLGELRANLDAIVAANQALSTELDQAAEVAKHAG